MPDIGSHTTGEAFRNLSNGTTDNGARLGPSARQRSSRKRWIISAVVIALVAAMAAQLITKREELGNFQRLSGWVLLLTVALQIVSQLLWNAATLMPLQVHMKTLGFWELFMLRTGGFIVGNVVPVAGNFAVRMTYLRRHGLAYADFAWATVLVNVLGLFAGAVLAIIGVGILFLTRTPSLPVLLLAAGMLAGSIAALAITRALPRLAGHPTLQRWPWLASMRNVNASGQTIVRVFVLSFLRHVFNFLEFGALYYALSATSGGFLTGGLVYVITSPIRVVAVMPGDNLGLNEWLVAIVGRALYFDVTTGLLVALAYRGISVASQVVGVIVGGARLAREQS